MAKTKNEMQVEATKWAAECLEMTEGDVHAALDLMHTERENDDSADAEAFWALVEDILSVEA